MIAKCFKIVYRTLARYKKPYNRKEPYSYMEKKNIIWILSLSIIIILLTAMFAVMQYQSREAPDGSHNISREDSSAFSTVSPPSGLPETDRDGGLADTRRDTSPHTEEDSGLAAFLAKQDAIADEMLKIFYTESCPSIRRPPICQTIIWNMAAATASFRTPRKIF